MWTCDMHVHTCYIHVTCMYIHVTCMCVHVTRMCVHVTCMCMHVTCMWHTCAYMWHACAYMLHACGVHACTNGRSCSSFVSSPPRVNRDDRDWPRGWKTLAALENSSFSFCASHSVMWRSAAKPVGAKWQELNPQVTRIESKGTSDKNWIQRN